MTTTQPLSPEARTELVAVVMERMADIVIRSMRMHPGLSFRDATSSAAEYLYTEYPEIAAAITLEGAK